MPDDFQGKTALVTGGTLGIGYATVRQIHNLGARVIVCARDRQRLDRMEQEFSGRTPESCFHALDVTDETAVRKSARMIKDRFVQVHYLVNCAGGNGRIKPVLTLTYQDWITDIKENFFGTVNMCKHIIPLIAKHQTSSIVNIASIAGSRPSPHFLPYCIAKGSTLMYTKAIAEEIAWLGIRVNAILPGYVNTRQMARVEREISRSTGQSKGAVHDELAREIPLGRYAEPEEIAQVIVFLLSPQSSYITGSSFLVEGGVLKEV